MTIISNSIRNIYKFPLRLFLIFLYMYNKIRNGGIYVIE